MGLIDRDYMHQNPQRQRSLSPPPERSGLINLGMWLVLALVLFALYKASDWNRNPPASAPAPTLAVTAPAPHSAVRPVTALVFPPQPASPSRFDTGAGQVTKCIVKGQTSYGDTACPQGALNSQVTMRLDQNMMDRFKPQTVSQAEPRAIEYSVQAQTHTPYVNEAAAKKSHCQTLDASVKQWDAEARQPQTGPMQDWISTQRKQARDHQFRLHCR